MQARESLGSLSELFTPMLGEEVGHQLVAAADPKPDGAVEISLTEKKLLQNMHAM